jgi:methylglutaconyl-CoA hydratase
MQPAFLSERHEGPIAYVTLTRPEVRNAFNAGLIAALHACFERLGADQSVRAIVLAGEGKAFCGGADVNVEDARALSRMYRAIDRVPVPVIARVQGAALGGGAGLVAVCDIAIAADTSFFGFTETKLGVLPAVISPFVLAKIGLSHARALALTGERFDARRALSIGLVHEVVPEESLGTSVARVAGEILSAGPSGIAATKRLFAQVVERSYDETLELTAAAIATQRTSPEGQDGLRAFLEKRKAGWVVE